MGHRSIPDELDVLRLVAQGDEQAFRKIFDLYRDRLYNYVFRITDSGEVAEEIVLDAFMKVWINRADLNGIIRFDSYLYTVVRNQAYNAIKRVAHEAQIIKELGFSNTEYQHCTEDTVIYNDYQHLLNHAVENLPPQQKRVYNLSRNDGLKYDEIAVELNLSKNTVKAHLKKAVSSLRIVFSNYMVLSIWVYFSF